MKYWLLAIWIGCVLLPLTVFAQAASRKPDPSQRFVYLGSDGKLIYPSDDRGNRVLDFSHCGYRGGNQPIPQAVARVAVAAKPGDSTQRIQAAIDYVAGLPLDGNGLRGAVVLLAGRHEIAGQLRIATSGVVLRGTGSRAGGTELVATGQDRRTLIRIVGRDDLRATWTAPAKITDSYVPVGATRLKLNEPHAAKVGDLISITHPSTKEWIGALGMDRFPTDEAGSWLDWKPGTLDIRWDRQIVAIVGPSIEFDVPITCAIDAKLSRTTVSAYSWPGRLEQIGVEHLKCSSEFDAANPLDEQHAWGAIGIEHARDAWVRDVTMQHFAGSAVAIWESSSRVTVENCTSDSPVSEIGGWRRRTFFTSGEQTLFRNCSAQNGCHDFAVGYGAAGPNAFLKCVATNAHNFSGGIESWACGVLYDNVKVDGGGLSLTNRETQAQGIGWAAANCVLWQCVAPTITCRMPPTAQNWAIGCWGEFTGDGHWRSMNEFVDPNSLYESQLVERLGSERAKQSLQHPSAPQVPQSAFSIDQLAKSNASSKQLPMVAANKLQLQNGWLVCGDRVLVGGQRGTVWWRGQTLPALAGELGVGVTRFVPGRVGPGFTDDLGALAEALTARGNVVLDHHWGLWYDRRRDDHQMVRRIDGEVWAPFYEQPWARSGQGHAWDGLSKYDLERFNDWYFSRLSEFATEGHRHGVVLKQQMYFQHNILEAGAHWADFPWRPANCLQATGFPEPPPYVNDKRIFVADIFYDVENPLRRRLHKAYIRHCLDVLGSQSNVIFSIGEEFTGPASFVKFWLETILQWQTETGKNVLVSLGCTQDVQDEILAIERLAQLVDVVELKYWWYTARGELYAPEGGKSLAPRQQFREWKGDKSRSDLELAKQVREIRDRFPDKAITSALEPKRGWPLLAAGASLVRLPKQTPPQILASIPKMKPCPAEEGIVEIHANHQWCLGNSQEEYLAYISGTGSIRIDNKTFEAPFFGYWLDDGSGKISETFEVAARKLFQVPLTDDVARVLWLSRSKL